MLKTPGWLVAVSAGVLLLVIAIAWAALPWNAALIVTGAAFLGNELGVVGARWHDDRQRLAAAPAPKGDAPKGNAS